MYVFEQQHRAHSLIDFAQIFLETYWHLKEYRESLDEDQEMIPPSQITLLFVDWTDPQKAV